MTFFIDNLPKDLWNLLEEFTLNNHCDTCGKFILKLTKVRTEHCYYHLSDRNVEYVGAVNCWKHRGFNPDSSDKWK